MASQNWTLPIEDPKTNSKKQQEKGDLVIMVKPISLRAIVAKICGSGLKSFAVAYIEPDQEPTGIQAGESITFSISTWLGKDPPQKEQVVWLENVQKFAKGWRATSAEPIVPESKQQ